MAVDRQGDQYNAMTQDMATRREYVGESNGHKVEGRIRLCSHQTSTDILCGRPATHYPLVALQCQSSHCEAGNRSSRGLSSRSPVRVGDCLGSPRCWEWKSQCMKSPAWP